MTTLDTPLSAATIPATRTSRLARHQSTALLAAFTLSATHTVYAAVVGVADPQFTVTTPLAWGFYAVGFTTAWMARLPSRRVQWTVLGYLAALLVVSVVVYPTSFVPARQTPFGWFENDVYVALLGVAAYLASQRLRRAVLA